MENLILKNTKVLINTPSFNELGGVANHYKGLAPFFSKNIFFHTVGRRNNLSGIYFLPYDIFCFIFKLLFLNIGVVVLNPSLGKNALSRDKIFLKITKLFRKKVIVFIHGWDLEHEKKIDTDPYKYFKSYFKVDIFLVLSSEFKLKLLEWGVTCDIRLTTTKVDDRLIAQFDASKRDFSELNFLFLSRIIKNKGVFEALDAFKELSKVFLGCKLNIVGDGSDLDDAKQYATSQNIMNVNFKGRLDGNDLIKEFISNNIYLFPSSHGEGMPTSVLEAMAFAMPIVTTYNAGLKDFFQDGVMGYTCEMKSSQSLFDKTKQLIETEDLNCISTFNYNYANNQFLASIVAPNLEKTFSSFN